jgi:hypothetical protein
MSRGTPACKNEKNYKEAVVSAQRLPLYFQLTDKNFRDITRFIYNFLRYLKTIMYLFQYCFAKPWTLFCGTQKFCVTQCEKHCCRPYREVLICNFVQIPFVLGYLVALCGLYFWIPSFKDTVALQNNCLFTSHNRNLITFKSDTLKNLKHSP